MRVRLRYILITAAMLACAAFAGEEDIGADIVPVERSLVDDHLAVERNLVEPGVGRGRPD